MAKVLIISLSNLKHDARVLRQVNFLKKVHELHVCCFDAPQSPDYTIFPIANPKRSLYQRAMSALLLLTRRFSAAHRTLYPYKEILAPLINLKFDLIIANDVETLPLAFDLKKENTKIIFDAHEYAPKHFEDKFWWRLFFQPFNTFLCHEFIPQIDGMMTIGEGLAREYERNFVVKPVVVTNSSYFFDLEPKETDPSVIKLVHHGIVNRSRKIELIIQMLDYLPGNFTLDLILVVPGGSPKQRLYLTELKDFAAKYAGRVQFKDPVPTQEIVPLLHNYDMGIILAPPINFNYSNGLPNKLFDFIQARLGVITGPTPEIAKVVSNYQLGVVADGFTSEKMAEKVARLTKEEVQEFKNRSHQAAKEVSAEKNENIVRALVASVLEQEVTVA